MSLSLAKEMPLTHQTTKKILVVEDDPGLREALEDTLALAKYSVVTAKNAEQAIELLNKKKDILMVVSDINMGKMSGHDLLQHITQFHSHIPVLLMTAYGSIRDSVGAIRNGAVDYLVKPFEPKELVDILHRQLGDSTLGYDETPIVNDLHSQQLLVLATRVARSQSTVLIAGESGTGKEVLARYVHQQSTRADKPFVAINCAAIPENMLEAMLFGYEKGAYTGAYNSTPGKFEQANGGTLLLDEISEMDITLQAKLLRVLQEKEVERLGGRKTIALDVRIIATSNRDMAQYVRQGKFREDLYYRLSVLPLVWKPLRERQADILPLAQQLLSKHITKQKRQPLTLHQSAVDALIAYPWPGNVRELDNVIQRALILQSGNVIHKDDLGLEFLMPDTLLSDSSKSASLDEPSSSLFDNSLQSSRYTQNSYQYEAGKCFRESRNGNVDKVNAFKSDIVNNALEELSSKADSVFSRNGINKEQLGDNLQRREFEIIKKTLQEEMGSRKKTAERLGISPRTLRYKLAKMRDLGMVVNNKMKIT